MDHAYEKARKRVKRKKNFLKELSVFIPVAIGMIALNLITSPNHLWYYWAIGPWALVLLGRGISIAIADKSGDWEEREMRKELRALGKNPDDYIDDKLELEDLEPDYIEKQKAYRGDDEFV